MSANRTAIELFPCNHASPSIKLEKFIDDHSKIEMSWKEHPLCRLGDRSFNFRRWHLLDSTPVVAPIFWASSSRKSTFSNSLQN